MQNLKHETHENWYRDVPKMKCLILGSFPPPRERNGKLVWDYPFYYPDSRNRFWKILAKIANKPLKHTKNLTKKEKLEAIEERYEIMCSLKVGVQNMGLKIERRNNSAKDKDIKIKKFQNIHSIIKDHSELEKILLPGFSASNSTAKSFLRYLRYLKKCKNELHNVNEVKTKDIKVNKKFFIEAFGRKIECVVVYSTSTALKQKGITKDILLKQFNEHLL